MPRGLPGPVPTSTWGPVFRFVVLALTTLTTTTPARADDPELETADGSANCRAFREKNEKELTAYEKAQPPVPYTYPRPDTFINAPWGKFFSGIGSSGGLVLATLLPHIGAQYRGEAPAALVSWPWSVLVIGPMYACSRKPGTYEVDGHRVHRFLIEPGLNSGKTIGFHVRPGYRFIWHPTSWPVGPGLGVGSTVEVAGNKEPFRYSIGGEAVAHFGNCCAANYFTFAFRYDHFLKGTSKDIIGGSLGYVFF